MQEEVWNRITFIHHWADSSIVAIGKSKEDAGLCVKEGSKIGENEEENQDPLNKIGAFAQENINAQIPTKKT